MAKEYTYTFCGCFVGVETDPTQVLAAEGSQLAPFSGANGNYFQPYGSAALPDGIQFSELPTAPTATGGTLVTGLNDAGENVNVTVQEIGDYAAGLLAGYAFDVTDNGAGAANQQYTFTGQPDGMGGNVPNLIGGGLLFIAVEGQPLTIVGTTNRPTPDVVLDKTTGIITFNAQLIPGQTIYLTYKTL